MKKLKYLRPNETIYYPLIINELIEAIKELQEKVRQLEEDSHG